MAAFLGTLHALAAAPQIPDVPLESIRMTDAHPVAREAFHEFTFVSKHSHGAPVLGSIGQLHQHWQMEVLVDAVLHSAAPGALMVDAGMNLGYFTLLSRRHGLRTLSIDIHNALMQYTVASLNRSQLPLEMSRMVQAAISDHTQLGAFEQHALGMKHQTAFAREIAPSASGKPIRYPVINSARLDDLVQQWYASEEVYLLKIDVEGQEIRALRGAVALFRHRRVRYGFIEIGDGPMDARFAAPGSPANLTRWQHASVDPTDAVQVLEQIQHWGYTFYIIVQCAGVAPHARFVQPASSSFWSPLADWPRVYVSSTRITRHPREEVCSSTPSTSTGAVSTGTSSAHWSTHSHPASLATATELIKVVDMEALVRGPLLACDWNLWFSREPM